MSLAFKVKFFKLVDSSKAAPIKKSTNSYRKTDSFQPLASKLFVDSKVGDFIPVELITIFKTIKI